MSWAQDIAARNGTPIVIVTIEGVGDSAGLWKFCAPRVPSYATASYRCRAPRGSWPSEVEERTREHGGVSESGELTVHLVDVDDELTPMLTPGATPKGHVVADVSAAATTASLRFVTAPATGTVLYIGREALVLGTLVSGTTYNVTRGALGTTAAVHPAENTVFLSPYAIAGRRVRQFVVFDKPGASGADEYEVSPGWWSEVPSMVDLNTWSVTALSQQSSVDRLVYNEPRTRAVGRLEAGRGVILLARATSDLYDFDDRFGDYTFVRVNDEILRLDLANSSGNTFAFDRRGVAGSGRSEVSAADVATQVWVANRDGGSIRFRARGAEAAGSWSQTDHPVPILLALLLASADRDGTPHTNYAAGEGNMDCLPAGVGLGVAAADIDWDSFWSVWRRTAQYRLSHFVLGTSVKGRAILDRVCMLCGFDLVISGAKYTLVLAGAPTLDAPSVSWDLSTLLAAESLDGVRAPSILPGWDAGRVQSEIVFESRSRNGTLVPSVWRLADFESLFGTAGFEDAEKVLPIDASDVEAGARGDVPSLIRYRAVSLLFRRRNAPMVLPLSTDWSQEAVGPAEVVLLTHPQVPTAEGRGVTDLVCKVESKRRSLSPEGLSIGWQLVSWGEQGPTARVSPSARVASVAGAAVTVTATRYTDSTAVDLPTSDAAAFSVGDVLIATTRAGALIATTPSTTTVQSIGSNQITLADDWSAYLSAGDVLSYARANDVTAAQKAAYAFMADDTFGTPGDSGEAYTWGEA
jgi:hypothetical protein